MAPIMSSKKTKENFGPRYLFSHAFCNWLNNWLHKLQPNQPANLTGAISQGRRIGAPAKKQANWLADWLALTLKSQPISQPNTTPAANWPRNWLTDQLANRG